MATDEEYLDNLLKSLAETEQQPRTMDSVLKEMGKEPDLSEDNFPVSSEDLADMLDQIDSNRMKAEKEAAERENLEIEDLEKEEAPMDASVLNENNFNAEMMPEIPLDEGQEDWKADIDDLLSQMEATIGKHEETGETDLPVEELEVTDETEASVEELEVTDETEASVEEPEVTDETETPVEEPEATDEIETPVKELEVTDEIEAPVEAPEVTDEIEAPVEAPEVTDEIETPVEAHEVMAETEMPLENYEDVDNLEETDKVEIPAENLEDADVTELIDSMENTDDDLAEINGLLKKADMNESVEDDMLALLESVKENQFESDTDAGQDSFGNFSESNQNFDEDVTAHQKSSKKKKDKAAKKKLFGKKQKEKIPNDIAGEYDESEIQIEPEKKPGFFSKILTLLTQEEDEPEDLLDENAEIMKELDEEDQQKAQDDSKKKAKKEKKKKGKKGEEAAEGEAGEGEDAGDNKKGKKEKKKKEKKEKKEKIPKEKSTEKPIKVLSKKNLLLLVALCATLVASIVALSTFLPDYSDKQTARTAFYHGDYETVYELLYNKHLSDSDTLIFNRVKTVLQLERKLDSYENNLKLGRELEALDALLQGVNCYATLTGVDEYGVREEVDALYAKICSTLLNDYQISAEDAAVINALDSITYTQKLNSVIYGTEFLMPGEEAVPEEPLPPQDVLPEEEEIISYE